MLDIREYSGARLSVLISGCEEQRHAGFYIKEGFEPELIHLGWHLRLYNNSESEYRNLVGEFSVLECRHLLDQQVEDIVSFVKTIWRKNQHKVPYGIATDNFSRFFDGEGGVANRNPGTGLTCATFLMSVFASQLYPVIDEETWKSRDSDREWQSMVLDKLLKYDPSLADHVEEQRKFVGKAFRYRPEEVVACSALYDYEPYVFGAAVQMGELLLQRLRNLGGILSSEPSEEATDEMAEAESELGEEG